MTAPTSAGASLLAVGQSNRFNKVQRIWKATPEYFDNPWQYFVRFIELLESRGARFITMSAALAGDYDRDQINILLDHHIDYYPIETEVMCRWELERGVVASVYLFNEFDYDDTPQHKIWRVEDLDLDFYQLLERRGFEIGYHQNAVGLVRTRKVGRRYDKTIPDEDAAQARRIFARDVDNLRRYFNIRTFIPHGAGEGNAALVKLPEGYEGLEWVYNNRSRNGTVRPKLRWQNWSDSCGQRPQRVRGYHAHYILQIDNLHVKAFLAEPGLNHVLIHPGRFGKCMPYELYQGPSPVEEHTQVQLEFDLDQVQVNRPPLSITRLITAWESPAATQRRRSWNCRPDGYEIARVPQRYYLLSDDPEVIHNHLVTNDSCIAFLLRYEALAEHDKKTFERGDKMSAKAVGLPAMPDPQRTDRPFVEHFSQFFNVVYTKSILRHLLESGLRYDVLHLSHLTAERRKDLSCLVELLDRYRSAGGVVIDMHVQFGGPNAWRRAVDGYEHGQRVLHHYTFETTNRIGLLPSGFWHRVRPKSWPERVLPEAASLS